MSGTLEPTWGRVSLGLYHTVDRIVRRSPLQAHEGLIILQLQDTLSGD